MVGAGYCGYCGNVDNMAIYSKSGERLAYREAPAEFDEFHMIGRFREGAISVELLRNDGPVVMALQAADPTLHLSDVVQVASYEHTTTDNDIWIDNLDLAVPTIPPDPTASMTWGQIKNLYLR